MKPSILMTQTGLAAMLVAGLALAGCNQNASVQQAPPPAAALPLTSGAATPVNDAPPANQLPPAPPARVARLSDPGQTYAYLDQASSVDYGFGDAPPDYSVDYDGTRPWVWRSDDGYEQVVEPLSDGDRYYYYRPGSDYPFLIRDPDYTYGYDNGALVVIYDHQGRALPFNDADRRADLAGRYLMRARSIYDASQQNPHQPVVAGNWSDRQGRLQADRTAWVQAQTQDPDWRAYHDQYGTQDQAHWDQERYRRQAEAARTAQTFNDVAGAALLWQAARQAQAASQSHGQPQPNGGGQQGGGGGGLFGRHDAAPQGPPPAAGPPHYDQAGGGAARDAQGPGFDHTAPTRPDQGHAAQAPTGIAPGERRDVQGAPAPMRDTGRPADQQRRQSVAEPPGVAPGPADRQDHHVGAGAPRPQPSPPSVIHTAPQRAEVSAPSPVEHHAPPAPAARPAPAAPDHGDRVDKGHHAPVPPPA